MVSMMSILSYKKSILPRLILFMIIIVIIFLSISIPSAFYHYHDYNQQKNALQELNILKSLVDMNTKIAKEQIFAYELMSSIEQDPKKLELFYQYRGYVNQQIKHSIYVLNQHQFHITANTLEKTIIPHLQYARLSIDNYLKEPHQERSQYQFEHAMNTMEFTWEQSRESILLFIQQSTTYNQKLSNHFSLILVFIDLQKQATDVLSTVLSPIVFSNDVPEINKIDSLKAQNQTLYLWSLIDLLCSHHKRHKEYQQRYLAVKTELMGKEFVMINRLLQQNPPYIIQAEELTYNFNYHIKTVFYLQDYIMMQNIKHMTNRYIKAQQLLFFIITLTIFLLILTIFMMVYMKKRIFNPILQARQELMVLSQQVNELKPQTNQGEISSLFEAIQQLREVLLKREALEFQLRNIANTDNLTGVSNRMALDRYIHTLEQYNDKLLTTGLMILDIDHFKSINDTYGHQAGDDVIKTVATHLKSSLRNSDLIFRYGGDEFLILIKDCHLNTMMLIARKLLKTLADEQIPIKGTDQVIHLSISIGVAVGATTWNELFNQADHALLQAKAQGRNQVVCLEIDAE